MILGNKKKIIGYDSIITLNFFKMKTKITLLFALSVLFFTKAQTPKHAITQVDVYNTSVTPEYIKTTNTFSYDSYGQELEYISTSLDSSGNITMQQKTEYSYNSNNLLSEIVYYNSVSGSWVNSFKEVHTYNSDNKISVLESYNWDSTNNVWMENQKKEFFYNTDDTLDYNITYNYDATNSVWVISMKEEYTYVASTDLVSLEEIFVWDATTSTYSAVTRRHYTYDTNNNNTLIIFEYFDVSTSSWVNSSQTSNAFDANNDLIETISYYWQSNNWVPGFKQNYTRNAVGTVTLSESFNYDSVSQTWMTTPSDRNIPTYSTPSVFATELIIPNQISINSYAYGQLFNEKLDVVSKEFNNTPYERRELTYTLINVTANVTNFSELDLSIYPNPVLNTFQIQGVENLTNFKLKIYDMKGRLLMSEENKTTINLESFTSGYYVYKLESKEGYKTGKIIKL